MNHKFVTSALMVSILAGTCQVEAQVENLRISEVNPETREVEVTNLGPAFSPTTAHPFCHRFSYGNLINSSVNFEQNGRETFNLVGLSDEFSDLWIYTSSPFSNADNIVQGLQYGRGSIGRAALASGVDKWSGAESFTPTPPMGMTLSWDGFGNTAFDWYVDETPSLGSADTSPFGTVPASTKFPVGVQDFESLLLGDPVSVIENWPVVDSSPAGAFTVRAVGDVLGETTPRPTTTQWLRIHDADPGDVENRFYGPTITALVESDYSWRFFVAAEQAPPASGDNYPRYTIQHATAGFANAWGVEYRNDGIYLIVTGVGGTPAEVRMKASTYPDDLGVWQDISISVDFDAATVSATIDAEPQVSLPINLDASADPAAFRFCYRGEGIGNVGTFLLDDVSVVVIDTETLFSNGFEE
ncbi:MAG: hypothetical protein AB8B96_13680 [Lysobacterales bacterium]